MTIWTVYPLLQDEILYWMKSDKRVQLNLNSKVANAKLLKHTNFAENSKFVNTSYFNVNIIMVFEKGK